MKYKLIDHTADFGIEVYGANYETLFINAAEAMFELILESVPAAGSESVRIEVAGMDRTDLLINWLRELLYLFNGEGRIAVSIEISSLTENKVSADVCFDTYSAEVHVIRNEIKAVPYHQADIRKIKEGLAAKIIFDV